MEEEKDEELTDISADDMPEVPEELEVPGEKETAID